ncbi:hypothetical protein EB796_009700 [Bugula neritina]|uniref:Uncharacterized protein n=1 Tax=Bugula neritina TaxID=10212 RepID=A0A7J7K307_BUGNE|nr:hypothetical protein EB796_009700 [Bugula neritina]
MGCTYYFLTRYFRKALSDELDENSYWIQFHKFTADGAATVQNLRSPYHLLNKVWRVLLSSCYSIAHSKCYISQ